MMNQAPADHQVSGAFFVPRDRPVLTRLVPILPDRSTQESSRSTLTCLLPSTLSRRPRTTDLDYPPRFDLSGQFYSYPIRLVASGPSGPIHSPDDPVHRTTARSRLVISSPIFPSRLVTPGPHLPPEGVTRDQQ